MDYTIIDFERDPILNREMDLDQRIRSIFPVNSMAEVPTKENPHVENPNQLQANLKSDSKENFRPVSPTQYILTPPSTASVSSSTPDKKNVLTEKQNSLSLKSSELSAVPLAKKAPGTSRVKSAKWESPDEKIHRYRLSRETSRIKKNECTNRFIALKQATRKIDTRKPLPDRSTVKILQVKVKFWFV